MSVIGLPPQKDTSGTTTPTDRSIYQVFMEYIGIGKTPQADGFLDVSFGMVLISM